MYGTYVGMGTVLYISTDRTAISHSSSSTALNGGGRKGGVEGKRGGG